MDSCRRVSYNRSSAAHPLHLTEWCAHIWPTVGRACARIARTAVVVSDGLSLSLPTFPHIHWRSYHIHAAACASPAAERCPNLHRCHPSTCTYPALPSMPGHAVSHHAMPCHGMPPSHLHLACPPIQIPPSAYHAMPWHDMPAAFHASWPRCVRPRHALRTPCPAMPPYPMPSHGVSYHAVPYHTPQWYEGHHNSMKDAHNTRTWTTRLTRTQQPHAEWRLEDLRIA